MSNPTSPHAGTLTSGAATVQFDARYQWVDFWNLDTNAMWIRADGTAPVANADGSYYVPPIGVDGVGGHQLIANANPMWFQGFGSSGGLSTTNPGTTIKIVGTGSGAFEIIGR